MPRFVILEHHHDDVHWDLMLESAGLLRTWRLATRPDDVSTVVATPLPDHRLVYLDYEGEIGGGRGYVTRWDSGEFEWIADGTQSLEIVVQGGRLAGRVYLFRDDSGGWTFKVTPRVIDSPESAAR